MASTSGDRLTVHPGRARNWQDVDADIYAEYVWLRSLGIGVSSAILFDIMEHRRPSFTALPYQTRWSWFISFKKWHQLSMRRPSRSTEDPLSEDISRLQQFVQDVKQKIRELQVK